MAAQFNISWRSSYFSHEVLPPACMYVYVMYLALCICMSGLIYLCMYQVCRYVYIIVEADPLLAL